jgi:phosphoribosyl-AMP cyclohydrolase
VTTAAEARTEPRWGPNGLAPAIVQDAADGRVLVLAWMDEEAWRVTHETGVVHFHSRRRDRLWRKGETSGHELRLREAALDCDADAILLTVDPIGPTCHRDTRSCFDPDDAPAEGEVDVTVNYTNCVQCGAITAKGGRLTTPEGGDGPLYQTT